MEQCVTTADRWRRKEPTLARKLAAVALRPKVWQDPMVAMVHYYCRVTCCSMHISCLNQPTRACTMSPEIVKSPYCSTHSCVAVAADILMTEFSAEQACQIALAVRWCESMARFSGSKDAGFEACKHL